MAEVQKLRELAAWYREFADRAGNPSIWASRLRMAEDLEAKADQKLHRATSLVDELRVQARRLLETAHGISNIEMKEALAACALAFISPC
jgi:hypothetical protein